MFPFLYSVVPSFYSMSLLFSFRMFIVNVMVGLAWRITWPTQNPVKPSQNQVIKYNLDPERSHGQWLQPFLNHLETHEVNSNTHRTLSVKPGKIWVKILSRPRVITPAANRLRPVGVGKKRKWKEKNIFERKRERERERKAAAVASNSSINK